jgi:CheY-like chemotaxis protein
MERKLILVVEDNAVNMELVRDVLHAKGYRTLEATSGEAALELVRGETPHLILLDIQLPGINGIETLARLREIPATADTKPIDVPEFVRAVAAYCDGD